MFMEDFQIIFSSTNSHVKNCCESYRHIGRAPSKRFSNLDMGCTLCGKVTDLHIIQHHSSVLNNR
jgi:hypothetical protein